MKTIKFAKDFKKLYNGEFATLRLEGRQSKYVKNKEYRAITPTKEFIVKCTYITSHYLKNICDEFLMEDTDTNSREEALGVLMGFYPDLTSESVLTAIWFKKVES